MTSTTMLVFSLVLGWAVAYYVHWVHVRRRFVAISPGRVYQSGAMAPQKLIRCARRHSIDTIIDFRGAHEDVVQREALALSASGIRHINIPVGSLPTPKDVQRFNDVMREELRARRAVLLHCKDGEGRAVAFAAIYRIQFEGWSALKAYRRATRLPPAFRIISLLFPPAGLLSPRNSKTRLILDYRPTSPGLAPAAEPLGEASI
jgi:protein tyrosine phosphatase (PTP) superfamily phosphohydrolase (DUF442 family)